MSVITALLDKLFVERQALQAAQASIPVDIQAAINEAEGRVKCLEAEVKSKAKFVPGSQAHTLVGSRLQLVWSVRKAWDESDLQALATRYNIPPAELDACKKGTGGWSIRARGQK
jgi:hypothetical protein